ncbi:MAG: helix-turn-helix domain-containing protein [Dermatophilaceae bacterium]
MPSTELRDQRGSLGTVRNAVTLLELLAEGPAHQHLSDLAERSQMSVPTVHRLLRSLVLSDLVEQDPRSSRYGLGPELVRLSHRYLARLPIIGAVAPYLTQLRDLVGGTILVQVMVRSALVTLDRVDGSEAGLYRDAHAVRPPLSTASGRLLLARGGDAEWQTALEQADPAVRELAEASRAQWAGAPWLAVEGAAPGLPGHVAVALVDAHEVALATLVAVLPHDASDDTIAAVAGHLTRAGSAAVRMLGNA